MHLPPELLWHIGEELQLPQLRAHLIHLPQHEPLWRRWCGLHRISIECYGVYRKYQTEEQNVVYVYHRRHSSLMRGGVFDHTREYLSQWTNAYHHINVVTELFVRRWRGVLRQGEPLQYDVLMWPYKRRCFGTAYSSHGDLLHKGAWRPDEFKRVFLFGGAVESEHATDVKQFQVPVLLLWDVQQSRRVRLLESEPHAPALHNRTQVAYLRSR